MIPTYDPLMLESNLFRTWGEVVKPYIHHFSKVFHINRIEDFIRNVPAGVDNTPYRLTVCQFVFLTAGKCTTSKGLSKFEFERNTFFIVPAYEIKSHDNMSSDACGYFCYFNPELVLLHSGISDSLTEIPFLTINGNPEIHVSTQAKDSIETILNRLEMEYAKGKDCRQEVLQAYLRALFVELRPFAATGHMNKGNDNYRLTEQFCRDLSLHIYEYHHIDDYAAKLKISTNRLNKITKEVTGKSAVDLLHDMILLEAKVLLRQTSLSISEITYKLGQKHVSNFTRFFRHKTGYAPGEYRNEGADDWR
ncbi:MAG TPA: helix-turn-helix domain-containing protein [Bacteroidales bacterium]|nr:helix-turn-helix domain-containing protein [Bacteroidales bacterium]